MKNRLFLIVFLFTAIIISCNNESENATDTSSAPDSILQPVTSGDNAATSDPYSGEPAVTSSPAPQSFQPTLSPSSVPQTSGQSATTTAPGMNPPHGEPGHKCEIAVGAPLNSAPAVQPSAPVVSPGATMQPAPAPTMAPQPQAGTTAPGMNPPHGEPGHDCAIPVGSPLKK